MGTARSDSPPKPRPLNSPQGGATLQNGGVAPPALGGRSAASCRSFRALVRKGTRSSRALFLLPAEKNPGSLFQHTPPTPQGLGEDNTTINHTALSWGRRKARRTEPNLAGPAATRGLAWRDDRGLVMAPANPTVSHHTASTKLAGRRKLGGLNLPNCCYRTCMGSWWDHIEF